MKTQHIRGVSPLHMMKLAAATTLVFVGIFILFTFATFQTTPVFSGENTAPVGVDSSFTVAEGSSHNGSVSGTDADGDSLTFQLLSGPSFGTLTFNSDGSFSYSAHRQPTIGFESEDSFTFKANDGALLSEPATVSITIVPVNAAPEAHVGSFTVEAGATHSGSVTGSDLDGDTLTFELLSDPFHGSIMQIYPDGSFTYTADSNYSGPDSFTFKANDGLADSSPATIDITITATPPKPIAGQLVDEVLPGSLSEWAVNYPAGNPSFTHEEIVSPYDGSTALRTSVVGTTIMMCNQPNISRVYSIAGNTDTTQLQAYLAFSSTMQYYTFPYVVVEIYDEEDERVGSQVYYGQGVIGGLYAHYASNNPESYTELPTADGDMTLDLSVMGEDIDFSSLKVTLANYACEGQNSVTFDHLRVINGEIGAGGDGEGVAEGNLVGQLVSPTEPLTVYQNTPFVFKSSVQCVDGNCGDITATLYPKDKTRLLIYNPNVLSPEGVECKGNYGALPYDYLEDNNVEVTFWCSNTVVDASVLQDYDVLYVGRARSGYQGATYINSTDLKSWVSGGGGAILESTGDSFEPNTSDMIWPGIYDLFGYNNCPSIGSSDNAGGGPLNKFTEHPIWDGVEGPVGSNSGLYDSELYDSCIGTGVKIGTAGANAQSPMVNEFGLGRTYSGVLVDYTLNENSEKYFLNVVNWLARGGTASAIPTNTGKPFYTTSQNPQTKFDVSCLGDMQKDNACEQSWTVVPTGRQGSTYEFFTVYDSSLGKQTATTKINITIFCDDPDGNGVCADAEPDTTPPVITLLGSPVVEIEVGKNYVDAGATALDNVDGDVEVVPTGIVDTTIVGTYTITYTATDSAGNTGTVTRTVKVTEPQLRPSRRSSQMMWGTRAFIPSDQTGAPKGEVLGAQTSRITEEQMIELHRRLVEILKLYLELLASNKI